MVANASVSSNPIRTALRVWESCANLFAAQFRCDSDASGGNIRATAEVSQHLRE